MTATVRGPGETYYPSMMVNLTIRFDETIQIISDDPNAQARVQALATAATYQEKLIAAADLEFNPPYAPLVVPNSDNLSLVMNRVPKEAVIELLGVRHASKFTMVFDWRELPLDPRLIRAIGVEIHLGNIAASEFAAGMAGGTSDSGVLRSQVDSRMRIPIVPGSKIGLTVTRATLLMFGLVDTCSVKHADDGSWITLEGRDLRGVLLDAHIPPARAAALHLRKPINEVVAEILQSLTSDLNVTIQVLTDPAEWDGQRVPSPGDADGLTRVRQTAAGTESRMTPTGANAGGGDKISYWDLITQYCGLVGAIPYFYGHELWIRPARNIFDIIGGAVPPPFAGNQPRDVGESKPLTQRRLVYGRDISEMSFERKYGGSPVPIIEVVGIDDRKRGAEKLVVVQWPPVNSLAANMKAESEKLIIPVAGIRDAVRLLRIARDLYEEIGRGEMGGSARTKNLASFGGDGADPDMVKIRPTDSIELAIDTRALSSGSPLVSTLNDSERRTFAEQVAEVQSVLKTKDPNIARALVATARSQVVDSIRYFRVGNVKYTFNSKGLGIAFDFQNYLISRHAYGEVTTRKPGDPTKVKQGTVTVKSKHPDGGHKGQIPKRQNTGNGALSDLTDPDNSLVLSDHPGLTQSEAAQILSQSKAKLRELGMTDAQIDQHIQQGGR